MGDARRCGPSESDYRLAVGEDSVTGITRIRYSVSPAGQIVKTEIVQSAGPSRAHRLLDRLAERALRQCRDFKPAVDAEGRPIGGLFEVEWTIR